MGLVMSLFPVKTPSKCIKVSCLNSYNLCPKSKVAVVPECYLSVPEGYLAVPEGYLSVPEGYLSVPEGYLYKG